MTQTVERPFLPRLPFMPVLMPAAQGWLWVIYPASGLSIIIETTAWQTTLDLLYNKQNYYLPYGLSFSSALTGPHYNRRISRCTSLLGYHV
jgi:hypothetical protein